MIASVIALSIASCCGIPTLSTLVPIVARFFDRSFARRRQGLTMPSSLCRFTPSPIPEHRGGALAARATTYTSTHAVTLALNNRASSSTVEPVVITASTLASRRWQSGSISLHRDSVLARLGALRCRWRVLLHQANKFLQFAVPQLRDSPIAHPRSCPVSQSVALVQTHGLCCHGV